MPPQNTADENTDTITGISIRLRKFTKEEFVGAAAGYDYAYVMQLMVLQKNFGQQRGSLTGIHPRSLDCNGQDFVTGTL